MSIVGDDIAWIKPDADGRLRAINPEAGVFGVAPARRRRPTRTRWRRSPRNTIFTNVALTPEGGVWWEGMTDEPPAECLDWRGDRWTPEIGRETGEPAAHPNARFTAPASQCPIIDSGLGDARTACRSARSSSAAAAPPPCRSSTRRSTGRAGVYVGATMGSETTAAATGKRRHAAPRSDGDAAVLRLSHGRLLPALDQDAARRSSETPKIFHVNWFRKDADGRFLWPGFRENMRVLKWIVDRVRGRVPARETPIGWMPRYEDIDWRGLDISAGAVRRAAGGRPGAVAARSD